jgi:hypothetical protein
LTFENSQHPFDLPKISQDLSRERAISADATGDDMNMLVGPVMVLDHAIAIPPHFPNDMLS